MPLYKISSLLALPASPGAASAPGAFYSSGSRCHTAALRLVHDLARQNAHKAIDAAPDGYMVEVKEPTRNLEQNALMWALLTDISNQVEWHGIKLSPDEYKDLLSAGLVKAKVVPNA